MKKGGGEGVKEDVKERQRDKYINITFANLQTLLSTGAFLSEGVRIFPAIRNGPNSLAGILNNGKE